jgi:hypothetical protein
MEISTKWQIFVSYSHADRDFVKPITDLIRVAGVRVFRDEDSIAPGKQWKLVISKSLTSCRTVLVFWSSNAARSKAVEGEYRRAVDRKKDVVPVLLDDTPLPEALSTYQWIDFRQAVINAQRWVGPTVVADRMPGQKVTLALVGIAIGAAGGPVGAVAGGAVGWLIGAAADKAADAQFEPQRAGYSAEDLESFMSEIEARTLGRAEAV